MNIVFWAVVIIGLIAIWFALTPWFKNIGESAIDKINEAKEEMTDNESKDN